MLIEIMEDLVIDGLSSKTKDEVIKEIASKFKKAGVVKDKNKFIEALLAREKIESTAIGGGIAIPHARSDTVKRLTVGLGRSKEGVNFDSLDGKPTNLIFIIASPSNVKKEYLQTLARIARICKNNKTREALINAKNKHEILGFIKGFNFGLGRPEEIKLKKGRTVYPK